MKKIVYVVGGLYAPSGMGQVLSQKINYLAEKAGYEMHAILTEKADLPFFFPLSPKVQIVNFNLNFDELDTMPLYRKIIYYEWKQRKYKKFFTDYLLKVKPDITVSALRRDINFLNSIQDGSIKVGELHNNRSNYRQFNNPCFPGFINKAIREFWVGRLINQLRKLNKFIVLSHEDKDLWTELNNVEVIHNPLIRIPTVVSDCTSWKVIAAGRYTWEKGFDLLIEAWQKVNNKHPHWKLYIYGAGDNQLYQELANKRGIGESVFCEQSTKNIYEKYTESSIFVLSSRFEGFGLVIGEAMACGLPAVSFSCPCGPRCIINDGKDGLLVERENTDQLADKINYLIEHEDIRKEMGKKARLNANRFEESTIMKQWVRLFESLT